MAFLLDEDLPPEAAERARDLGLDVLSVSEIGRTGLSPRERLSFAGEVEWILVTRNREDFVLLTRDFFGTGAPHSGILVVPRALGNHRPGEIARAIRRWAGERDGTALPAYAIDFLPADSTASAAATSSSSSSSSPTPGTGGAPESRTGDSPAPESGGGGPAR